MDVRIEGGDIRLTDAGLTEYVRSVQEAAQRALIAASTTKGSFIYDRGLGVDYAAVNGEAMLREKLDILIREACVGIEGADVTVTACDPENNTAALRISCAGGVITTEVDYHGNL